jgi:fructokinase
VAKRCSTCLVPGTRTVFTFDARPGGSPFNVAIGLERLGTKSGLYTGISNDFFGQKLIERLNIERVDHHRVVRSDAPTTTAVVSLSEAGIPRYAFRSQGAADCSLTSEDRPDRGGINALHFGSYSLVAGSTAKVFADLMADHTHARFISVDPNVRPTMEPDLQRWRVGVTHAVRCGAQASSNCRLKMLRSYIPMHHSTT